MTFINEKVTEQDIEKYGLREINKQFVKGDVSYYWTIDRDRNIYLRDMGGNWQEPEQQHFSFLWKGHLLRIELDRSGGGSFGGKGNTTWKLREGSARQNIWLPDELEVQRECITEDLKDALIIFKDNGYLSTVAEHTAQFLF